MSKLSRAAIIIGGGLLVAQSVVSEMSRSSSDDRYNTAAYVPHYEQAEKTQVLHTEIFQEHPGASQVDYDVADALRARESQRAQLMVPKGRLLGDRRTAHGAKAAVAALAPPKMRLVKQRPLTDPGLAGSTVAVATDRRGQAIPIVEAPARPRRGLRGIFSRVANTIHQKWIALKTKNTSSLD